MSLDSIISQYKSWNDVLSQRLLKWAEKPVNEARIEKLKLKILINPLQPDRPLIDPWLDREWTWEKQVLDATMALTPVSPFDGKPFDPKPHEFARAILDLYFERALVPVLQSNPLIVIPSHPVLKFKQVSDIHELALNVHHMDLLRKQRKEMKRILALLPEAKPAQMREAQSARRAAFKEDTSRRIEGIQKSYESDTSALENAAEAERKIEKSRKKKLAKASTLNSQMADQIEELKKRIASL